MSISPTKSIWMTTLHTYFTSALIPNIPEWFHEITLPFAPRPYQVSGLNTLIRFMPSVGLFDDMGLGKTLQMQAALVYLAATGNKCVAIMPPAIVHQFYNNFNTTFGGIDLHLKIAVINGDQKQRQAQINDHLGKDILIMSYPTFLGRKNAKGGTDVKEFCYQTLYTVGYSIYCCDEAHKLKNHQSKVHQAVAYCAQSHLAKEHKNGLILATGTPTKTNVEDAYGLIKLLDDTQYGSKANFDWEHCVLLEGAKYRKVIEYKNLDLLHKSLFARARRMTKQQVFKEMPKRVTTFIDVTLSKPHKDLYDKLVDERMLELEDTLIDATTQQALYQLTQRILLSPDQFTDKPIAVNQLFVEIDEIIEELQGRKLVVFAWYKQSCVSLVQRYTHLNPVLINGETTSSQREQARQSFINDPDCKLFIANWNSGGEGLDGLQYVSSHVVFAEVCPHPGAYEQAVSRLERSGQTESVNVYVLVPKGTIATKLKKDLLRKDYLTNEVIKDKKVLLRELKGGLDMKK